MSKIDDYYLNKQREGAISEHEKKLRTLFLQIDQLPRYLDISCQYLDSQKIEKEVIEKYPAWTGYENIDWINYHYEAFGNFLYAYCEAWEKCLKKLGVLISETAKTSLEEMFKGFKDQEVKKIIKNRNTSVHDDALWRFEDQESLTQEWSALIAKRLACMNSIAGKASEFRKRSVDFICTELVASSPPLLPLPY